MTEEGKAETRRGEWADPRKEFGKAVTEAAEQDSRIVVISADSGKSSGFGEFMKRYPDRYFELGIMEQGAVGIASGLAATGKIPVFCGIAPFVSARPFEMFRNDLGYMKQNAKIVGRNCGFTYSDLGATHHSLEDFAIIRMIPGVVILAPQDAAEIKNAVKAMLEYEGPVYMRIGNPAVPVLFEDSPFVIGRGKRLREGSDLAIITTGSVTPAVLEAADSLKERGIYAQVIGMPTVCPIDRELILQAAAETGKIMTVEEHYAEGGIGTMVSEICAAECPVPVRRLGVPKVYAATGSYEELLELYGLDKAGVEREALQFLEMIQEGDKHAVQY